MEISWWLALGALLALAFVASVVDGRARLGARRAPHRKQSGAEPRPGEIWRARIRWERSEGVPGEHPCLVLGVRSGRARVARITIRRRCSDLPGVLPLPPGAVGDERGRPSYLQSDVVREIPLGHFRRRVGEADPLVWERIRRLAG